MSDETQALCFLAGANSIFYGEKLLTTENPTEHHDRGLFEQLGIRAEQHIRGVGGQRMTGGRERITSGRCRMNSSSIRASCGARSTARAARTMPPRPCKEKFARACSSGWTSCGCSRQRCSTSGRDRPLDRELKRRYPAAQVIALDSSLSMLGASTRQQRFLRKFSPVCADAQRLPLRSQSFDLVLSNLLLEWCHDPDTVFAEAARVLRPKGLFMFTTLGPDTLKEVRDLWRGVDPFTHVHRFIDMHDFGDALLRAGFAEPVMDTERLTVTYRDFPRCSPSFAAAAPATSRRVDRAGSRVVSAGAGAIAQRGVGQERSVAHQRRGRARPRLVGGREPITARGQRSSGALRSLAYASQEINFPYTVRSR
jgi:SAM-dependent methyltransferase